jgi:hypothetical protein
MQAPEALLQDEKKFIFHLMASPWKGVWISLAAMLL